MARKNKSLKEQIQKHKYLYSCLRRLKQLILAIPKVNQILQNYFQCWVAEKQYRRIEDEMKRAQRSPQVKLAVVIHLYYIDSWPILRARVQALAGSPFTLFITLPPKNQHYSPSLLKDFREAHIFIVPNRGRDVLPFTRIANILVEQGYAFVLKLHSKKSTHRTDGKQWFEQIVNSLLPDNPRLNGAALEALAQKDTAIVGPSEQYLSLRVNFVPNYTHLAKILAGLSIDATARKIIQNQTGQFGFFAGTMFWARLDAIAPVVKQGLRVRDYEPEGGQIDRTYAHALERAFCLLPEIEHKNLYEISIAGLKKVDYASGLIPEWSDQYGK